MSDADISTEQALRLILKLESSARPPWDEIKTLSDRAIRHLNETGIYEDIPNQVYQFLEDYDVRRKDPEYASYQYELVGRYLGLR